MPNGISGKFLAANARQSERPQCAASAGSFDINLHLFFFFSNFEYNIVATGS